MSRPVDISEVSDASDDSDVVGWSIAQHLAARRRGVRAETAIRAVLTALEHYIYHAGYGPTNETLGKLMRDLFGQNAHLAAYDSKGSTRLIERTARTRRLKP